ncbi:MAG: tetratricopeptide repeat protein [Candidatus Glassbacteria bacterium]|nr:tetratricopeptide repeat protein [Candidatus Glassbacteria bacterium]
MKLHKFCLLLVWMTLGLPLYAAEMVDLQVFSEDSYVRVAFRLDEQAPAQVETNLGENLVFIRFDSTGISAMPKQSFLYAGDPHLESVTLLPLGQGSTVARIKARHPFRIKTYEINEPARFVLELTDVAGRPVNPASTGKPAGIDKPEVIDYYRHGLQQLQAGSYNAALMSFRSAIRAGSRVADSYYQAGVIRCKLFQFDKALINFTRANTSSVYGDEARLYLCWIHYKNGNYPAMRNSWQKFVNRLPDRSARIALAGKHPEIDYRILETAVEAATDEKTELSGSAMAGTPDLRLEIPQPDATVYDRDSAAVYFESAMALKADNHLDQAAAELERAVSCDPDYSQAYFQLGVVYKSLGKNELSAASFEKSLQMHNSASRSVGEIIEAKPEHGAFPGREHSVETVPAGKPLGVPVVSGADPPAGEDLDAGEKEVPGLTVNSQDGGGPSAGEPPAEGSGSLLGGARTTAARMVSLAQSGLLRKQVKLLTLITGILFILTLLGEHFFFGRFFRRKAAAPSTAGKVVDVYRKSREKIPAAAAVRNDRSVVERNKKQVAEVLASELAAIQHPDRRAVETVSSGLSSGSPRPPGAGSLVSRANPAAGGGIYGDDIARRIKEELSGKRAGYEREPADSKFSGSRNDVQTRLIHQLRSKEWSISDIAQEMGLSREEVKWALSNSQESDSSALHLSGGVRRAGYGQARGLNASHEDTDFRQVAEKVDHEVDLELQINI